MKKNAVGRIGDQANKISKQAKKFSDKVRTLKNKPKKFMDNLESKLSNAATNKSNSRFKRFTAKTAKNGIKRLRKMNSTEMAISAITAAAVYTSEDGAMGKAAAAEVYVHPGKYRPDSETGSGQDLLSGFGACGCVQAYPGRHSGLCAFC